MRANILTVVPASTDTSSLPGPLSSADIESDDSVAAAIARVLGSIPVDLQPIRSHRPMLDAVRRGNRIDLRRQADALLVLAAAIHADADERWVADYLLRHRAELADGRRSPMALLRAARFAAEMDVRKASFRELPLEPSELESAACGVSSGLESTPSVADLVVRLAKDVAAPARLDARTEEHVRTGVLVFLELAERHRLNGGTGAALLAMRPAARREARLVTRLAVELDASRARAIARLLIGSDGGSLETALLWWAAQGAPAACTPVLIRRRWQRDLGLIRVRASSRRSNSVA